jgi:NAD+ kinase
MLVGCIPIHEADGKEKLLKAHALNDVVVARQGGLKILPYDVYVNGQYLTRYQADGVIIATPTGSTGYNMSAGGPIVEPEAKLILLTPICPHTLSPRSIILSAEDTIEILIGYGRNGEVLEASVNFDGSAEHILQSGDCIRVSQSGQTTSLATIRQSGFLENLHRKMNG